jgi:Hg(II)-responsive transcriptional regulator
MVRNMRTGQLAEQVGVNLQTVRYYERRGLLAEPPRRDSGYREYGPESVDALRFIKRAQQLGFTLNEVEQLLHLAAGGPDACDAARALANHRIADLDTRIADLQAMRDSLERLAQTCERPHGERECALLQSLAPAQEA